MGTLLDLASLVMIPSGYKDDVLYSVKPTDGSGDFTFSRDGSGASPATRVNASGLIEKGRENLLTYSQDFSNAAWPKGNISLTANQTDPNGGTNAFLATTTNTNSAYFYQVVSVSGIECMSVYAKAGTRSNFSIIPSSFGNGAYFDLSNETSSVSGVGVASSIEAVGNGWYRCSVSVTAGVNMLISLSIINGGGMTIGDTMSFAFAQLESGLVATDYIETTTAPVSAGLLGDMPRLDYSGGATCPSLLLEPSRVNQAPHSEYIGGWVQSDVTGTDNFAVSPEGVQNAAKITASSTSAGHFIQLTGAALGNDGVVSMFAKADTGSFIQLTNPFSGGLYANFDVANGVVGTKGAGCTFSDIENYGNGWYRCIAVFNNTGVNSTTARHYMVSSASAEFAEVWNPSTDTSLFVYGHQFESGSYPTSYIPTYGSASTRAVDDCEVTGASDLIGQTEGTMFLDFVPQDKEFQIIYQIRTTGSSNVGQIDFRYQSSSLRTLGSDSATTQFTISYGDIVVGQRYKCAVRYTENDVAFYVNGTLVGTDLNASFSSSSLQQVSFSENASTFYPHVEIKQALLFKTPLTNAELAALTTL